MAGPAVPLPISPLLAEALDSVTVTHNDEDRSGFQIVFRVGRGDPITGLIDYPILMDPSLSVFSRVIVIVTMDVVPQVLIDGIITHQQHSPSSEPGGSTFTITGEDISLKMDLEEKSQEHVALADPLIATMLIASYGLIPLVIPPASIDQPIPIQRTPVQQATDLQMLRTLAAQYGYVFYVQPGPLPMLNTGYWGPKKRVDLPQPALNVNLGPETNVKNLRFQQNALSPTLVKGNVMDSQLNTSLPVQTFVSTNPPMSTQPTGLVHMTDIRTRQFRDTGVDTIQAFARAQGITDAANDSVTAQGEIDALRYNNMLQPRSVVGVRGAGYSYDGLYYVKNVSHRIQRGNYTQQFTLTRDGIGSMTPVVRP
jgi:hypothetical protein